MNLRRLLATLLLSACGVGVLTACGESEPAGEPTKGDKNWVDYTKNGSVKLGLDYKSRSFWTDGVEQVTLKTAIDGDTAHFGTSTGETLKARFYGIDTPESTGAIQEYGKAASNYTKSQLKEAAEHGTIVISSAQSTYGEPNPDSTGSRYVSLVWINTEVKDADRDHLYLLNLDIVQEGYSWVKNVSDMPEYVDTFIAAEAQAKKYKLNLFSGEPDPLFNYGEYETTSLLDIKREVEASLKDSSHVNKYDGAKCRVVGTVAGYSNNVLYIQNFYADDPDHPEKGGEYAGLNIFTGMTTIPEKYRTLNTYIQVSGTCSDSENFGFQMSGCVFPRVATSENDCQVILSASENTEEFSLYRFQYTAAGLQEKIKAGSTESLYCAVEVTDSVKVVDGYTSDDGDITLYTSAGWMIYITFLYEAAPGKNWNSHEFFQEKTIKVKGVLGIHKTTKGKYQWQVLPSNSSDLVVVS